MLLRHRPPDIDTRPVTLRQGLGHLDQGWVAVLRWLNANKVDYVVVGPVAHAIRGELTARGPVGIVPAPYSRNFERLCNALVAQAAGLRGDRGPGAGGHAVPVKLEPEKLARGRRWLLRFAGYDLDIESAAPRVVGGSEDVDPAAGGARYQELLYESARFELAPGVTVEVASPEDLEHFSHVRRTGVAPEFRVIRRGPAADGEPGSDAETEPTADAEAEAERSDFPADT